MASMDTLTVVSQNEFRDAMSQVCAAVNIITTAGPAGRGGFTATAMCSLSDTPPSLLVCMRRASLQTELFMQNRHFCVNVLAGSQTELAGHFANGQMEMSRRYAAGEWHELITGSPALNNALVNFDCELDKIYETASHNIIVGRVVAIEKYSENDALTYFDRAYHNVNKNITQRPENLRR
ncbi:flavin reductase family protein [Pantoea sp. B65]|uniref:flavin reductase family protein n=1 Tax=Pantoea sp. B65 TaxID=2813359 RepID=UPI0039B542BB